MKIIRVRADKKPAGYRIHVERGLMSRIGGLVAGFDFSRIVVVSNPVVMGFHGDALLGGFKNSGIKPAVLTIPDGEAFKTVETFQDLLNLMLKASCDRKTLMVAFGGGVTGDLAGFAASAYMRGVSFVQVPTTLLAQVDSSIGGKVGVDLPGGKNLAGAFYNPVAVFSDPDLLETLSSIEMANGLAEVIKAGIIGKPQILHILDSEGTGSFISAKTLEKLIILSASLKAEIVMSDFKEKGRRMFLNLGHTAGHALEAAGDFRGPAHGQAVALGMLAAVEISRKMGILRDTQLGERLKRLYEKFGLPVRWCGLDPDRVMKALSHDKKALLGHLRFVLPVEAGKVEVSDNVELKLVQEAVGKLLTADKEEQ